MSLKPLQRVAIIGATGRIGGAFAKALLQAGKHDITALTRPESKGGVPEGIKTVKVNYDDEASLISALEGQQFLIISLGISAASNLHSKITTAAGKAGVPYIMPNVYGYPEGPERAGKSVYGSLVTDRIADVHNTHFSAPVTLACGFWYEWSLALGEPWFGFTIQDRKVTLFDDGTRPITVSTWDQCGRAVAALLGLPESSSGGPSPSPSLADYKDKTVLSGSFTVSQRDMLDSLHRVLGTSDKDWEITYEGSVKRVEEGLAAMQQGDRRGFAKALYCQVFDPSNETSAYVPVDNKVLGLPKEDLDEATKRAVELAESGWNPFAE